MNRDVLDAKFESIRRCLARIQKKTPQSVDELKTDLDRQDIIVINLERAVQSAVNTASLVFADQEERVPKAMGDYFVALRFSSTSQSSPR